MLPCNSFCLSKSIDLVKLYSDLSKEMSLLDLDDIIGIENDDKYLYIFSYGVIVFWGHNPSEEEEFVQKIDKYLIEKLSSPLLDNFSYSIGKDLSIKHDHLALRENSMSERVAYSHTVAQSVKLEEFELTVGDAIVKTRTIPANVAKTGSTKKSRKEISKMRGYLFGVMSEINLSHGLLDTPEFFWENPERETLYLKMSKYLEIKPRVDVLNHKLKVIHELLQMLADEQRHKHSSFLEWIIIILIALEIVLFFVHDIFKLF